jgi:hypothetical protein
MHQNHIPTDLKSRAIHCYCRKRWTFGIIHRWWAFAICRHWFILVSSQFPKVLFRQPTLPQWKQLLFSLLYLTDFFDPLVLLDVVLITTDWDFDLMHVQRKHLNLPLSLMPETIFRSYTVSQTDFVFSMFVILEHFCNPSVIDIV